MQYLKEVFEYPATKSMTAVMVMPLAVIKNTNGVAIGTVECSADDTSVVSFVVYAVHGGDKFKVVEYEVMPLAREFWLARALALAAAAEMSMRFNVPVKEMR